MSTTTLEGRTATAFSSKCIPQSVRMCSVHVLISHEAKRSYMSSTSVGRDRVDICTIRYVGQKGSRSLPR